MKARIEYRNVNREVIPLAQLHISSDRDRSISVCSTHSLSLLPQHPPSTEMCGNVGSLLTLALILAAAFEQAISMDGCSEYSINFDLNCDDEASSSQEIFDPWRAPPTNLAENWPPETQDFLSLQHVGMSTDRAWHENLNMHAPSASLSQMNVDTSLHMAAMNSPISVRTGVLS